MSLGKTTKFNRKTAEKLLPIAVIAVVLTALVVAAWTPRSSRNVSWLHTSGRDIYDDKGQRIGLYGANLVSGQGQGVSLADIQAVKALGFNAFRLTDVNWGLIQPFNETAQGIDLSFFATGIRSPYRHGLNEIVNWGVGENMYIIICLSWTQWWPPPKWAFPSITDDAQRYAALINGTAAKERTGITNVWRYISDRYKDVPNVIFELLNEPGVLDKSLAGNYYKSFNEGIISAIESVETQAHLKLVELLEDKGSWIEITDGAVDIDKRNLVWATHHYSPMVGWDPNGTERHGPFTWHGQYFEEGWGNQTMYVVWRLIRVADKMHAWNRPWINTEFSKNTNQAYWKDWYSVSLHIMAEYDISGWMFFCYSSDPTTEVGWNLKDPTTQQKVMPLLNPYLHARSAPVSIAPASPIVTTPFTTTTLTTDPQEQGT